MRNARTNVEHGFDFQVPQMVIITFDDAVNSENWDLYNNKLFIPER